jgi:hypothetical protein
VTTLSNPSFTGHIVIPADAEWDMSAYSEIPLHSGVSLTGERGALGSRPLLYTTNKASSYSLFDITGNLVLVEGLHLRGPEAGNRSSSQPYVHGINIVEDPDQELGRQIVINDNELDEWTGAAVGVGSTHAVRTPQEYDPSWKRVGRDNAGQVLIQGNYIHNNARDDGGYGVCVGGGAYATIEGNVFDYNRHDVASDGYAYSGYIARFNYVLEGGFMQGLYYNQHFDVHGTGSGGYGGPAGEYFEIDHNTIRGDQTYALGFKTRPALMLRGTPTIGAVFNDNVLVHGDLGSAVSLKGNAANFSADGNQFSTDHSMEIAAGDFDGDGKTDIFLATGNAWFYSSGGSQPWTYLGPSGRLTGELAFADIDNDGITDVLWRTADGTLYYSKSGRAAPVALTHVPVPVSELRFGDFDGDGKTDIFYTQGSVWNIWYSRTQSWGSPGGSSLPLSELLFGDFDGDGKTDILGVANGHWSISSSASQPWAKLNNQLTKSFANAVVGDFDGDGKPDIAFSDGSKWYVSSGGTSPLHVLRDGGILDIYPPLRSLLLGQFDGGRRTGVVSFERQFTGFSISTGNHMVIWRGPGSGSTTSAGNVRDHRGSGGDPGTGNAFVNLSPQEMR